jgi:hypothetical protein
MTLANYDAWLERPYAAVENVDDLDEAYDLYLAAHRAESDREFATHNHDFTHPDEFYAAGEQPMSFQDYCDAWHDDMAEAARYRAWEAKYPDARI